MSTVVNNDKDPAGNKERQDVDKAPGEERGQGDEVTEANLKGKQVDADPTTTEGKPLDIKDA